MPAANVDASTMIETLLRHDVRFVVVGGFAVELWGVAVPPTIDIDITPDRSPDNLDRLATALNELEAEIRYGTESVAIPGGFTGENIADMSMLNLTTVAGPLDLTIVPAGTDGYDELAPNASDIAFQGVVVPTADLEDVARSKEAAGRPKDIKVLPAIRAHLDRRSR